MENINESKAEIRPSISSGEFSWTRTVATTQLCPPPAPQRKRPTRELKRVQNRQKHQCQRTSILPQRKDFLVTPKWAERLRLCPMLSCTASCPARALCPRTSNVRQQLEVSVTHAPAFTMVAGVLAKTWRQLGSFENIPPISNPRSQPLFSFSFGGKSLEAL